jgi:hypothetical protein
MRTLWALLLSLTLTSCGGGYGSTCTITAKIVPASATADPSATPPGNQAQFSLSSSVKGNFCPLTPDTLGIWSTSDSINTTIGNTGLATCTTVGPTSIQATISNSSTVRGHPFTSATLTCK